MFSSMTYRLLFISATLLLSGCFAMLIGSCNDEDCSAPAEFISEIQTLGVTASTSTRPLVETVDTHIFVRESDNEAFVSGNGISLYFSPAMPVRATHIEIWFRRERSQEFTLMKRTPLDSLLYSPSCPTHC